MATTRNAATGGVMGARGPVRTDTASRNANLASRAARTVGGHQAAIQAHEFARDMHAREIRENSPGGIRYHGGAYGGRYNESAIKRARAGVKRHEKAIAQHRDVLARHGARRASMHTPGQFIGPDLPADRAALRAEGAALFAGNGREFGPHPAPSAPAARRAAPPAAAGTGGSPSK